MDQTKISFSVIFSKFSTSVVGPDAVVRIPPGCENLDYEAELGVVIGRKSKDVSPAEAGDAVFGYLNINDISARDFQFGDGQWQRGKSCDTFAPMGEYIATTDEIPDPQNLAIRFRLNGEDNLCTFGASDKQDTLFKRE